MDNRKIISYILEHSDENAEMSYSKYTELNGTEENADRQILVYKAFQMLKKLPREKLKNILQMVYKEGKVL